MAANTHDATTGYPIFLAGEAPDLGVDETTAAQYAADVGNRIIRANLTALNDYEYERAGLWGHALDTKSEYLHDGTGWKLMHRGWTTYTPTTANVSGSPTIQARYCVVSGTVRGTIYVLLNGANFATAPTFTLPLTARSAAGVTMIGHCIYAAGSLWVQGRALQSSTTTIAPVASIVSGANIGNSANVSASTPFTWANAHTMNIDFSYEAA